MSFFRSSKIWKSQGEISGLYGGRWSVSQSNLWNLSLTRLAVWGRALSCKRMIPSGRTTARFDFMACRSTLSHQETNYTSLLFVACLHFQCWSNHYTLRSPPEHGSRKIWIQNCDQRHLHWVQGVKILHHMWRTLELHYKISILCRYFLFDCNLQPHEHAAELLRKELVSTTDASKIRKRSNCSASGCKNCVITGCVCICNVW